MTPFARPEFNAEEVDLLLLIVKSRAMELGQNMRRLDEADAPDGTIAAARRTIGPQAELLEDLTLKLEIARKELADARKA